MKRPLSKKEYVIGAFFVLAALLPLATSEEGGRIDILPPLASLTIRERAMQMQDSQHERDRRNAEVWDTCNRRAQTDPDVVCPDVNDTAAVQRFLRGKEPIMHEAATGSTRKMLRVFDLTDVQQGALRRYVRVRSCPDILNEVIPGFLELCTKTLRQTTDTRPEPEHIGGVFSEPFLKPTLEKLIRMRNPD